MPILAVLFLASWGAPGIATAQQWEIVSEMPEARAGAAAVEVDGLIYVIGGRSREQRFTSTVFRYDPVTNEWSNENDLPHLKVPRVNAAAVALGRKIFVIGGRTEGGEILQSVEVFDIDANQWREFPDTKRQREGASALVLRGMLYLIGGSDQGERALDTVELYSAAEDRWDEISEWRLDRARVSAAVATLGSTAYVFGGFNTFGPIGQVQTFDVTSGSVSSVDMRIARGALAVAVNREAAYVIGGRSQDRVLGLTEVFHPDRSGWSDAADLNVPRFSHSATTVGDNIYVIGGLGAQSVPLATVEKLGPLNTAREEVQLPPDLSLEPAYPDPFAEITRFDYSVSGTLAGHVRIEVMDVTGRRVRLLLAEAAPPGRHQVGWAGDNDSGARVADGLYLVRLQQGPFSIVRKVVRVTG